MRWFIAEVFRENYHNVSRIEKLEKIAIIGGYKSDLEVQAILHANPLASIKYFGIDSDPEIEYLDLNTVDVALLNEEFDLVICSQVIEHIWNLTNFFQVLSKLTRKGGYLWISCPFSNIAHGSPEYYSAGYTPEFLVNNFDKEQWTKVIATQIGSKRNYVSTHMYASWLSEKELYHPILSYQFKPGTFHGVLWKLVRDFPGRIHLSMLDNQIVSKIRWATETFIMLKKSN
jgi:2-polyprenyl-3-methyl-5-hydroxy-6-metoxy-1,4-benzoquinol methylase